MSDSIPCTRCRTPLRAFSPPTVDGRSVQVGGCHSCGGLWVPVEAIRSVVPPELPLALARVDVTPHAPRCLDCDGEPRMAQQVFAEVEVDRCLYCHGLWFDAGELDTMSTRASEAAARGACDACGVASEEGHLASTGFGRLCRSCMEGVDLARSAPPPEPWSGLRRGELSAQWASDPAGGETLFEFLGPVAGPMLHGSITHENRFSRILKAVGSNDIQVGHPAFDARFLVKSSEEEAMRAWLGSGRVAEDLLLLDAEGGCTVRLDEGGLAIRGSQAADQPTPSPSIEAAADRIYQTLLARS